jgi:IS30 family transposase
MDKYNQVTKDRYQIWANKKVGFSILQIVKELDLNTSSIYRELDRNPGDRGYRLK